MATNLKGQGGITGILLLHGEKIAIAVVGVIALWFVYSAVNLPRLKDEYQATKLKSEISQTSTEIKDFTWERALSEHPDKVKKAQTIAAKSDLTVKADDYVNGGKSAFDSAIVAPLILRTDPVLLNPVDVRATGGSGLLAFLDEEFFRKQELRRQTEEAEREKKAADKLKKEQQKQQSEAGAPGGRRASGSKAAGEGSTNEVTDPDHPKRRMVSGSASAAGVPLQGGERIEQAYWACVVAKVPIREQLKLYQDAFEKARGSDATRDFPSYVGFFVERADVLPGKELVWKPVPLYDAQRQSIAQNKPLTTERDKHAVAKRALDKLSEAASKFWAGGISQDVIDDRYVEYPLTLPLPPLVGRAWGADATHPDIPLAIDTLPLEEETQQPAAQSPDQQPADADSPFGSANPTQGAPGGNNSFGTGRNMSEFSGGPGGGLRPRRFGGPEMGGPGMAGPGVRRTVGEGGPGGPEGGVSRGGGSGSMAGQHTILPPGVDYYLLRFFDFSVEPGKKYKYRVRLVVTDPNYNMLANVLAPAVLDRQTKAAKAHNNVKPFYREIETFSEPSPTVGIPMAGNVRLAEVKIPAAEKFNDEPTVKLLVEAFDVDSNGNAIQGYPAAEKDFRRGYVANMVEDADYLVEGGTMIDTQPGFKFLTGMTVLDVDGGTKLTKDMTVPARIMVMGPAGELYIRNEIDDKPAIEYHRLLFEKSNDKRRGPEGEFGPGGVPGRPRTPASRH